MKTNGIPRYFLLDGEMNQSDRDDLTHWMRVDDVERVFVPAVAYMPVPRCDGCKWWERDDGLSAMMKRTGWGVCHLFDHGDDGYEPKHATALAFTDQESADEASGFYTAPDFGCVQFEATVKIS